MRVATIPNRYNHKTCDNQGQRNAVFFLSANVMTIKFAAIKL